MCELARPLGRSDLIYTLLWLLWLACTRKFVSTSIVAVEQKPRAGFMTLPYTEWLYLRMPHRE